MVVTEGLIGKFTPLLVEPIMDPPEEAFHQFTLPTGVVPVNTPLVEEHNDAGVATITGAFGKPTTIVTGTLEGLEQIVDVQVILILPLPNVNPGVITTFEEPIGVTQLLPPPPPP